MNDEEILEASAKNAEYILKFKAENARLKESIKICNRKKEFEI